MSKITKHGGRWCIQGWPVHYLAGDVRKLGPDRAAGNVSMNGRNLTREDALAAAAFVPPDDDGEIVLINGYHGNADCACGERFGFSAGIGVCRFCGREWRADVAVTLIGREQR